MGWQDAPVADYLSAPPVDAPKAKRNPDGTYGAPPEGMFLNPYTGQMTSRDLLRNYFLKQDMGSGMSAVGGAADMGMLGFADEVRGALGAALGSKGTAGQRYTFDTENTRAALEAAQGGHPLAYFAGQVGAALVPTGTAAVSGGSLLSRAGRGALAGAAQGAAYGFGSGEGGFSERAKEAGTGAAVGGGLGFMLPIVASGIGKGAKMATNPIRAMSGKADSGQAAKAIEKAMKRSGMSADEIAAALQQAADDGQSQFALADALGTEGQRALNGVTRQRTDASAQIIDYLKSRQADQGNRLGSFISDALGAKTTAAGATDAMTAARKSVADKAYGLARNQSGPVDVRGALKYIDDYLAPLKGSGIRDSSGGDALHGLRSRLASPSPEAATGPLKGAKSIELANFAKIYDLKSEVRSMAERAFGASDNAKGNALAGLADKLDEAMAAASPVYKGANADYSAASRAIEAIGQGKAASGVATRFEDTAARYTALDGLPGGKALPASAPATPQQAFRTGYADSLLAKIDAAAPGVNKARPLLGTKQAQELGLMAYDPAKLKRQIGREARMFDTLHVATGGSATMNNLADMAESSASAETIMNALTGNVRGLGRQIIGKAANLATGRSPATQDMIARALLENNLAKALAMKPAPNRQAEAARDAIIRALRTGGIAGAIGN